MGKEKEEGGDLSINLVDEEQEQEKPMARMSQFAMTPPTEEFVGKRQSMLAMRLSVTYDEMSRAVGQEGVESPKNDSDNNEDYQNQQDSNGSNDEFTAF